MDTTSGNFQGFAYLDINVLEEDEKADTARQDASFDLYSRTNDTLLIEAGFSKPNTDRIAQSGFSGQSSIQSSSVPQTMQTVEQLGCGCGACAGGAPAISVGAMENTATELSAASGTGDDGVNAGKPFGTADNFADYMINGFWGETGRSARSWSDSTVTYSISNEFTASDANGIRMAFDNWADVTNLTFTEVAPGSADITIVEGDDGGAWSSSSTSGGTIVSNTISIDTNINGFNNLSDIGWYGLMTATHEIGHSLGLGHTGNYNGSADYGTDATWSNDTRQYTVMSYFDANNSGADHSDTNGWQYASTPLLYDIYTIQQIYGANMTIRTGNTTYGFNSNAGRDQYDFTITNDPVVAIWDAGGTDTLDLSGYSVAQTIRLGEGEFSDVGGMTGNLAIAYNTVIENATGGSGADNIYGNTADNVILGGNGNDTVFGSAGDDTLNGQAGDDTLNYSFSVTAFAFNFIDSVTVSIQHAVQSWTDLVSNIENFIFTDGTYTFAELEDGFGAEVNDFAPTITVNDISLVSGASALASSVVTATDADGNPLTYEVWDSTSGNNTGYFELNGTALSAGVTHSMTASQFSTLNIVGGNDAGDDMLWVRVSDGAHTTSWQKLTLTTTAGGSGNANAPTASANSLSLNQAESVLASSVITASDADGDTLTYEVWDGGTAGSSGYFELNGNALSAGRSHSLTQAEFDSLNIVGGGAAGNETLWVRVSDGVDMTNWISFTLTTGAGVGGGGNAAPTVTANNFSLLGGQAVLASTVINANDADGDTLTYDVWDGNKAGSSGYFELNGNALTAGMTITLTQAEFDNLNIVGGSAIGTDNLWVRVSDGQETTAWDQFTLSTTTASGSVNANAPTVTANDISLNLGQSALASSVISANDADGDTLTYQVWDGGTGSNSGYFELNGSALSAGSSHNLTQAQFNNLNIVGGYQAGDETLWVRVSDGAHDISWVAFTLTSTIGGGGAPQAPDVTTNNLSLGFGDSALASTVITATDANGDTLTYEVWDSTGASTTGYFELGGNKLSSGTGHTLTQAEFDTLRIIGGSANGQDTLWIRTSDGMHTTSWQKFTLTTDSTLMPTHSEILDTNDDSDMSMAMEELSSDSDAAESSTTESGATDSGQLYGGDVFSGAEGFATNEDYAVV